MFKGIEEKRRETMDAEFEGSTENEQRFHAPLLGLGSCSTLQSSKASVLTIIIVLCLVINVRKGLRFFDKIAGTSTTLHTEIHKPFPIKDLTHFDGSYMKCNQCRKIFLSEVMR